MLKGRRAIRGGLKPHLEDPYLTRKSHKEPTLCPRCGLVYKNKHWQQIKGFKPGQAVEKHKCPACRKVEDHFVMGILYISGGFFTDHRNEVIRLINNEVKRGMGHNPLDRIISIVDDKDGFRVETASENLAVHLGKVLYHAYDGEINYRFSDEQKIARVFWKRESKEVK